jgi:hypothetical protein
MAILQAAANEHSEDIEVVIATLDDERKKNVNATRQTVAQFTGDVVRRGGNQLDQMDNAEWERLVEAAERGE